MGHSERVLEEPVSVFEDSIGRWYVYPEGTYPSITTVLGYFQKEKLEAWREFVGTDQADAIGKVAAIKGTKFHQLIEEHLKGESLSPVGFDIKELFLKIKPELDYISDIRHQEQALVSHKNRIAGRVDCIARYKNIPSIIDFKSSSKPKEEREIVHYFEQLAGYGLMYEEMAKVKIRQGVCILSNGMFSQTFVVELDNYTETLKRKIEKFHEKLA